MHRNGVELACMSRARTQATPTNNLYTPRGSQSAWTLSSALACRAVAPRHSGVSLAFMSAIH